jgi:ABC-type spermidine/putrescine transport system permease subunit I
VVEDLGRVQVRLAPTGRGHVGRHLLLLPSLLLFVALFLVPLAIVAVHSFGQVSLVTFQMRFGWTLQNYRDIGDPLYRHTLVRSLLLSASTTALCVLAGLPLAYFTSRQSERLQRVLLLLVIVPFWTSFVVRTYSMVSILENGGPLDDLARNLGLVSNHLNFLYTPGSIGVGMVYSYLPLMVLPIYVALGRVDRSVLEAASDLGAGGTSTFGRVVLPLAKPGLVAGATIVGISATGEYVIPEILGGGKTLMLGNIVANQFLNVGDYPFGSAIAMTLLMVLAVVLLAAERARRTEVPTA